MKKLFRLLIMTVFLGILLFVLVNTFGLFQTEGIGVTQVSTGKWVVKINDVDITEASNANFIIDDFVYVENAKVAEGKIAPNSEGYFDLVIDPTGTDVSVEYNIDFDFSIQESLPSLKITVEDLTGGEVVKTGESSYSGIIKLEDIKKNKTNTLRIKITWENNEANNESDSALGMVENSKIAIPITFKAIQYTNETTGG